MLRLLPALVLGAAFTVVVPARAEDPTLGFVEYPDTFKVQSPYDLPTADRYDFTDGVHTCWIKSGDKPFEKGNTTSGRTEMRWNTWANQDVEHMWEADMMFEAG